MSQSRQPPLIIPPFTDEQIYIKLATDLPPWFGILQYGDSKVISLLLFAYIYTTQFSLEQLRFCNNQIFLPTLDDQQQLELFVKDYFGNNLPEFSTETFTSYKNRVSANLLALRATRPAMVDVLTNLTGFEPTIFEPWNPLDTGVYGGVSSTNYTMYYGLSGAYGSGSYAYQCFITVFASANQAMGNYSVYLGESSISPYNGIGAYSGVDTALPDYYMQYGGESLLEQVAISPEQIYNTINLTKVFGTICWVDIQYV